MTTETTSKKLTGKIALVTGGSRGIGRAIALRLAQDGASVAVHYGSNRGAAEATVRDIETAGGVAFAVGADLSKPDGVQALYAALDPALTAHTGEAKFDILVNNAGIAQWATVEETTEEIFDVLMAVNVKSPFFIIQHALPRLRDGGRIINVSSAVTRLAFPEVAAYSITKGALNTLTLALAKQLGPRGITVNALLPGVIDTDITAGLVHGSPESEAYVAGLSTFGRVGQPDDVADAAAFLASDDSRWVTAQLVDVSGGAGL